MIGLIQDQGIFTSEIFEALDHSSRNELLIALAIFLLQIVAGLNSVQAVRDAANGEDHTESLPCLPHELVAIKTRQVVQLVLKYRDRLSISLSQCSIDSIVEQHKQLLIAFEREPRLKSSLSRHSGTTVFNEAWSIPGLNGRFPQLMEFFGGLATPFPNTDTFESDFSVLKWEKDIHRSNLTPISLEGIFHCRQIRSVLKVANSQ